MKFLTDVDFVTLFFSKRFPSNYEQISTYSTYMVDWSRFDILSLLLSSSF